MCPRIPSVQQNLYRESFYERQGGNIYLWAVSQEFGVGTHAGLHYNSIQETLRVYTNVEAFL